MTDFCLELGGGGGRVLEDQITVSVSSVRKLCVSSLVRREMSTALSTPPGSPVSDTGRPEPLMSVELPLLLTSSPSGDFSPHKTPEWVGSELRSTVHPIIKLNSNYMY